MARDYASWVVPDRVPMLVVFVDDVTLHLSGLLGLVGP